MPWEHAPVMLEEVASGAAVELFDHCIKRVLENIDDPNTKNEAKRSFTLKFTVAPDEDAVSARLAVEIGSIKLAPIRGASVGVQLAHEGDNYQMLEVKQTEIPMPDNVEKMKTKEKK